MRLGESWSVEVRPPPAAICYRLGRELEKRKRQVDASERYRAALAQQPDFALAAIDLAVLHQQWGDAETALVLNRQALRHQPDSAQAYHNLGLVLSALGRHEEALEALDAARVLAPDSELVGLNRAQLLLLLGRWEEGWEEYEWRWKLPRRKRQELAARWDGAPLGGRTLVLFSELGMGDTIQMLRYLPLVIGRGAGGRVLLACQEPLRRLMSRIPGVELLRSTDTVFRVDCEMPLCSLPRLFATRPDAVPPQPALLHVPERSAAAQAVLGLSRPRIGLVWAGNSVHLNDSTRSMPFGFLRPLIDGSDYAFVSLQKGIGERDLERARLSRPMLLLAPLLEDMADTAAAIMELDLIIAVDTAVAHLAATLRKPTWLLLAYVSDWRWLLGRDTTPWYPMMRIFRQRQRGDWPELVERLRVELEALFGRWAET
jgi:hypothetical protein